MAAEASYGKKEEVEKAFKAAAHVTSLELHNQRLIAMALKISNDLERIGDYAAKGIAARCHRLAKGRTDVGALQAIPRMAQIVQGMMKDALDAYVQRDADKAVLVWRRDDEIDLMYDGLVRELLTYMMEDTRNISACIDLMFIAKNLERMGEHTTNICEQIRYIVHGERTNRMPEPVVE